MATIDVTVLGYLRPVEEGRRAELLERCLTEIAGRGYYLAAEKEHVSLNAASAGISEALQMEKEQYRQGQRNQVQFDAYSAASDGILRHFAWSFALDAEEAMFAASVSDRPFASDERGAGLRIYEHWLELLQLLSSLWQPLYGFAADLSGVLPYTERKDVLALRPRWLYDINIFGNELVEHLGRQQVLSTPAWKILPLEDGGVLLAPVPYRSASNPDAQLMRCAQHLGLPFEPLAQRIRQVRPELFKRLPGGDQGSQSESGP